MNDKLFSRLRVNSAGKVSCRPEWRWDTSRCDWGDFDLWTVLDGRGRMISGGRESFFGAGDCFLLRDEEDYLMDTTEEAPISVIFTHFSFLDASGAPFRPPEEELPGARRKIRNFPFFAQILERVVRAWQRNAAREAAEWLRTAFLEIAESDSAANLPDAGGRVAGVAGELMGKMAEHPEGNYSIAAAARKAGCSRDYFSRQFKRLAGTPFKDYFVGAKMERAKLYLRSTDQSVGGIAEELGYKDPAFFCRQFKKKTGLPPLRYRASLLPKT